MPFDESRNERALKAEGEYWALLDHDEWEWMNECGESGAPFDFRNRATGMLLDFKNAETESPRGISVETDKLYRDRVDYYVTLKEGAPLLISQDRLREFGRGFAGRAYGRFTLGRFEWMEEGIPT